MRIHKAFVASLPVYAGTYKELARRAGLYDEITRSSIERGLMEEITPPSDDAERLFVIVPQHPLFTGIPGELYAHAVNSWTPIGFGGIRELFSLAVHIRERRVPSTYFARDANIFGFGSTYRGERRINDTTQGITYEAPDLVSPELYIGRNGQSIGTEAHTQDYRVRHSSSGSLAYTLLVTRCGPEPRDKLASWRGWAKNPHALRE